jgi:L-arabinose 1-dehydrogenase [NAD(P)+]
MHVAITGAGGAVGRILAPEFESDRLTLFTYDEADDLDSQPLDATDREAFVDALRAAGGSDTDEPGVDVLVHLAWAPADHEEWNDDHAANVAMTANAFEAALANDVDRVVVASSGHAVGMYNRDDPTRFESTVQNPTDVVDPAIPPRPDSFYGVAKVAVEATAAYYADRHGVEAVVVRIGWLMTADELRETQSDAPDRHRFARAMWLSPRDCRALFRAAVEAPLERSPVVAHGISRNGDRFLTLTETTQRLGYQPRDDACEVLDE